MDEPHQHPLGDQRRLGRDHSLKQGDVGVRGLRGTRVVTGDRVVGEPAKEVDIARAPGVLEAAHPQMAARDAGQDSSGQRRLAVHGAPRRHHGQGARRGNAQRVHRLTHDVLAQHRTDRGQAVAAAGERRGPRALEVDVAKAAVSADDLCQQERAPVAETRVELAELVSGVGLRYRGGAARYEIADQQA